MVGGVAWPHIYDWANNLNCLILHVFKYKKKTYANIQFNCYNKSGNVFFPN